LAACWIRWMLAVHEHWCRGSAVEGALVEGEREADCSAMLNKDGAGCGDRAL
jgi:hypothetical protein